MDRDYFHFMGLEENEEVRHLRGGLYLHTIIDMGEKGELGVDLIRPAVDYMKACGYSPAGQILGEILIKTHEGPAWHRYMELKIPVNI